MQGHETEKLYLPVMLRSKINRCIFLFGCFEEFCLSREMQAESSHFLPFSPRYFVRDLPGREHRMRWPHCKDFTAQLSRMLELQKA